MKHWTGTSEELESTLGPLVWRQRAMNNLFKDLLDTLHARIVTGQVAPFKPIRIFGWTPQYHPTRKG